MTPASASPFEPGKPYKMIVLGATQDKGGSSIFVEDDKTGLKYIVEVSGNLKGKIFSMQGQHATLICTAVTEKGPEFVLDAEYFVQPKAAKPRRGGNIDVNRGEKVEFKNSLIYNDVTNQPDPDQPFEIAKQIAAFMNAEGGDLYIGVDAEGYVTGIDKDFQVLDKAALMMNANTDKAISYSKDIDGFRNKLKNTAITYLGQLAASLLPPAREKLDAESGLTYLHLHIEPCKGIVYLGRDALLVCRSQSAAKDLIGMERDKFVATKAFWSGYEKGRNSTSKDIDQFKKEQDKFIKELEAKQQAAKDEIARLQEALAKKDAESVEDRQQPPVIVGTPLMVASNASVPFDSQRIDALKGHFEGLVRDDRLIGKATSWADLWVELVRELETVDPAKFNALPDEPSLRGRGGRPIFARKGQKTHLRSDAGYLGKNGDIRVDRRDGSKAAFCSENGIAVRLIRHFGLKPEQFRIWTGKR